MRVLKCYLANNREGHFVRADKAMNASGQVCRSLILCFHTEIWQRIGEYYWQRQQEWRHSPPTILFWLLESACVPACRVMLLMNLDMLMAVRNPLLMDIVFQEMYYRED
ncbi:Uncharacterised protein [Klebsiella pneumoniae]|nr:Uncharacterised protein [Klebsiella pneumoniae]